MEDILIVILLHVADDSAVDKHLGHRNERHGKISPNGVPLLEEGVGKYNVQANVHPGIRQRANGDHLDHKWVVQQGLYCGQTTLLFCAG